MPFVGKRLAQKIEEIITSGDLRRLQAVDKEKQAILTSFTNIHGVGQVVAEQFYAQVGTTRGALLRGQIWYCVGGPQVGRILEEGGHSGTNPHNETNCLIDLNAVEVTVTIVWLHK